MAAAEEGAAPLMYQTVALKVSIHCEGCKKKVKKVLQSIEGVYKTDVDIPQHKVVVVGNVSVDALVKKLVKTGKHAEPWPEPAPPPSEANTPGGEGGGGGSSGKKKKKKKNKNKPAGPVQPGNAPAEGGGGGDGSIPPENPDNGGTCDEASGDEQPHQLEGGGGGGPHMAAPVVMTPHGVQPMAPPTANVNAAGGGGKKKKKKSKGGGNGNANANANGDGAGATTEMNPQDPPMNPAAGNAAVDAGPYPPATAMSQSYPPGYYSGGGQVAPPYAMSYSTAHPLRSSAYYHPMVGAMYTGGAGYFHSTAPASAAPGSYYMFSEENANACSVM